MELFKVIREPFCPADNIPATLTDLRSACDKAGLTKEIKSETLKEVIHQLKHSTCLEDMMEWLNDRLEEEAGA